MELQVFIRQSYGKKRVYPADDKGKILAQLTKSTAWTMEQIEQLKQLSFTFKVIADPNFMPGEL